MISKILLKLAGIITIICGCAGKKDASSQQEHNSINIDVKKDNPIDFGYKMTWIAVKTGDKNRIAEILKLQNIQESNWESGIEKAYRDGIFITPQIGEWTLVVGMNIASIDTRDDIDRFERVLNELSAEFGEAQSFGTYRVVDYHHWIRSENGVTTRVYSYLGESGENIKVFGDLTEAENGLNLFNAFSKEAESEDYYEREDIDYADESLVMNIAEDWSVNPIKLTERKDIKDELGLVGN